MEVDYCWVFICEFFLNFFFETNLKNLTYMWFNKQTNKKHPQSLSKCHFTLKKKIQKSAKKFKPVWSDHLSFLLMFFDTYHPSKHCCRPPHGYGITFLAVPLSRRTMQCHNTATMLTWLPISPGPNIIMYSQSIQNGLKSQDQSLHVLTVILV